jgi:hypothetical protein
VQQSLHVYETSKQEGSFAHSTGAAVKLEFSLFVSDAVTFSMMPKVEVFVELPVRLPDTLIPVASSPELAFFTIKTESTT